MVDCLFMTDQVMKNRKRIKVNDKVLRVRVCFQRNIFMHNALFLQLLGARHSGLMMYTGVRGHSLQRE